MEDKYKDFDSIGLYTIPSDEKLEYDFRKAEAYAKDNRINPRELTPEDWEKFRINN